MNWLGLPWPLWQAFLSLELASITAALLWLIGLPLAHWLNQTRFIGRPVLEALIALPIVLPPTVIGFYLLVAFAPQAPLGHAWLGGFGQTLAFSFPGLVVGSIIYSLPFAVQPYQAALRRIPKELLEASAALGAGSWRTLWHIRLPWARAGIFAGTGLAFAHTLGEFGVVLMLGGNLAGETRVASIALYDLTQSLDYTSAHRYALVLLGVSFVLLLIAGLQKRMNAAHAGHR
ncbi:MAG: molybdate ABC transporter permease subunit [Pseudomonadota bacterium]